MAQIIKLFFSLLSQKKKYKKNDVDLTLSTRRVTDLSQDKKEVIIDLLEINMKKLYEESEWGWNAKNKRDEMLDDHAWYLLAEKPDGTLVAFSHFRFDMDYDDEVLYVYEIQVDPTYQRKGLGRFMMQVLELLGNADIYSIIFKIQLGSCLATYQAGVNISQNFRNYSVSFLKFQNFSIV